MKIHAFSSTIRRKEMDAVLTCMVEEKIGPGEVNQRLTQYAKDFFGVDGVVALRSPSLALKYILKALDFEPGTKIMISALAPAWQILTLEDLGYEPLVLDVSIDTALVSPDSVHEGMKEGGRALILHETMGQVPDFDAFKETGIPIIEDISQNAGSSYKEKKCGSFGIYSILGLEDTDILTSGGGALVMAPSRREWIVLKKYTDAAPSTDILPDINGSLGFVQLKEFNRNEAIRKELYEMYIRSLMQGKHKSFSQASENSVRSVYSFPVVLSSGYKDVKAYADRMEIEIVEAFSQSVIALRNESIEKCINAKSLCLRTALFPLYPRLGSATAAKIAKVLATLP